MRKMTPEEWIVAILVIVMVLMVAAQVASRYVFHVSLSHTEELVRYLFVWATVIGAAGAVAHSRHLSITSGLSGCSPVVRKAMRGIMTFGAVLFAGILLFYGGKIVYLQWETGQETAALGMPMWVIGLAAPVGGLLILLRIILKARQNGEESV